MKLLITILTILSLTSCQTIHKIFNKQKVHTDSTAITKMDSILVHHLDSTGLTTIKDSSKMERTKTYERKIVIEDFSKPDNTIVWTPQKTDSFQKLIRRITITENGKIVSTKTTTDNKSQDVHLQKSDSASNQGSKNVTLIRDVKTVSKDVTRTGVPIWVWFLIGIALILFLIWRYRKQILLLIKPI